MGFGSITQNAASAINKKVGSLLGVGTDYPLYDQFVTAILQDADNTIPEKSHWIGFFDFGVKKDSGGVKKKLASKLKDSVVNFVKKSLPFDIGGQKVAQNPIFGEIIEAIKKDLEVHPWVGDGGDKMNRVANSFTTSSETSNAVMFLTGVKLPGDGFEVSRNTDFNVGGFLALPTTGRRTDLPSLQVSFIETNTSLVDLLIRPWTIHSSYASLKFANRATLNVFNLTRSPSGFRVRKKFKFHNVVPIEVDSEEYVYSADTNVPIRQVRFVYSDYIVEEGDTLHDDLMGFVKNTVGSIVLNAARKVVAGGADLVGGGIDRVVTNVGGNFMQSVRDIVVDTQSTIREYAQHAENTIIDKTNIDANKILGRNPKSDNITFDQINDMSSSGVIKTGNTIPMIVANDGVDSLLDAPYPVKSSLVMDNVRYSVKSIDSNDFIDQINSPNSKFPENNDTPDIRSLNYKAVPINNDDNILTNSVQYISKSIDINDTVKSSEVRTKYIAVPKNDSIGEN